MDRDKGSIGGLVSPPQVSTLTQKLSLLFDFSGFILSFLISPWFFLYCLIYTLVSKAYSWHGIRLKRHGILSFIIVSFFQGGFTYFISLFAAQGNFIPDSIEYNKHILPSIFATLLIAGFYPLSQIFQHEEDADRGDETISLILGVKGTIRFSFVIFIIAISIGVYWIYSLSGSPVVSLLFFFSFLPSAAYFCRLFYLVELRDFIPGFYEIKKLNDISAISLLLGFFLSMFLLNL